MSLREFRNRLNILTSIDQHELVEAEVINHLDWAAWTVFRRDPFEFFVRADDATAERIWALILRRETR